MTTGNALHPYPYFNWKCHYSKPSISEPVAEALATTEGPIIEIGGPTENGYRMLHDRPVFTDTPIVTSNFACSRIDKVIDGTAMSGVADGSVGVFLASHMSYADYFRHNEDPQRMHQGAWSALAEREYEEFLADPDMLPVANLRINMLREMTRALRPGGLIIFEALGSRDVGVAQALGHSLLQTDLPKPNLLDCAFRLSG
jgi:hypothetical protein